MEPSDIVVVNFRTAIKALETKFGVPRGFLLSIKDKGDDWSFVIKLHSLVEAALNHYLASKLNKEELEGVFSQTATADRRSGKVAFLEALRLLPDHVEFIKTFSGLRNKFAHNISNVNLRIEDYWLKGEKEKDAYECMLGIAKKIFTGKMAAESALKNEARFALWVLAVNLLVSTHVDTEGLRGSLQKTTLSQALRKGEDED